MLIDNTHINNILDNVIWYYNDIYKPQVTNGVSDELTVIISSRDLACRFNDFKDDLEYVNENIVIEPRKLAMISTIVNDLRQNKHVQDLLSK